MREILDLRQELAELLGYADLAELGRAHSHQDGRVQRPGAELPGATWPSAANLRRPGPGPAQGLRRRAGLPGPAELGQRPQQKLREQRYSVSVEALRAYFPIDKVLSGLFTIVVKACTASRSPRW